MNIDLETGQTIMKEVLTVDALSTILLLMAIEAMYWAMRWIHVFLDNARYHHGKLVQAWLAQPGRRIKLQFIPTYCPHPWSASRPKPIERLWGLVHRHTTHNKCYSCFKDFLRDDDAQELAHLLRRGHRQLPGHRSQEFRMIV